MTERLSAQDPLVQQALGRRLLVRRVFGWIWRRWLFDEHTGRQCRVFRVTGWHSCLYDTPSGTRVRATFLVLPWHV